jgi:hypothetical protein
VIQVEICERWGDYWTDLAGRMRPMFHAQVQGEPGIWSCGTSRAEAIGELIRSHPERFAVGIEYIGKQAR